MHFPIISQTKKTTSHRTEFRTFSSSSKEVWDDTSRDIPTSAHTSVWSL